MSSRYDYTIIEKNKDGKVVTKSLTLPYIQPGDTDVYVISNITDRLDTLSYKYYQTPKYWWVLALVNQLGAGTMAVPVGTQLRIPADIGAILQQVEQVNK